MLITPLRYVASLPAAPKSWPAVGSVAPAPPVGGRQAASTALAGPAQHGGPRKRRRVRYRLTSSSPRPETSGAAPAGLDPDLAKLAELIVEQYGPLAQPFAIEIAASYGLRRRSADEARWRAVARRIADLSWIRAAP